MKVPLSCSKDHSAQWGKKACTATMKQWAGGCAPGATLLCSHSGCVVKSPGLGGPNRNSTAVTVQQVCGLGFYVNVEMSSAVM